MNIKKALITAAEPDQRNLPLQTLVDRDGKAKSALAIIVQEAIGPGVEEICVVVCPDDADSYRAAAGRHGKRLHFVEQRTPQGYRHAVWCARAFTGREPFLLLVGEQFTHAGKGRGRVARGLHQVRQRPTLRLVVVNDVNGNLP